MLAPASGVAPAPDSRDYNLSPLRLLVVWMSHWRVVVALPLGFAILAIAVSFFVRPEYRARGKFVPETSRSSGLASGVSGLASQFGLAVNGEEPAQSPQFYADLLRTRPVLTAVILHRYPDDTIPGGTAGRTLLDWLERPNGLDDRRRLEKGLQELAGRTTIDVDRRTNIVSLEVEMPAANLAAAVVTRYLEYLSEFNLRYRQSQARGRRDFDERQIAAAESTLTGLEERLRRFYEQNRLWESSPALRFEETRLRRRVDMQQELFLSLRRELETARIAEVNDTPVLTVLEPPIAPARRSSPRRTQWAWLVFVLTEVGVLIGLVLYQNRFHWQALDPDAYEWLRRHLGVLRRSEH